MSRARTASLIGAPTDVGAADRGASMGPEALRVAGLAAALGQHDLGVVDLGNLNGPGNPWQPPQHGYRHLPQYMDVGIARIATPVETKGALQGAIRPEAH